MSDKKRFNYVFCDLDGTLLEDKQRHYECYKAIVKKYGGNCIPLDEYWNDKRNKVKRTVLLEKTGFQGTYDDYLSKWLALIETPEFLKYETLKPDTLSFLEWLGDNSEHIVLTTQRRNRENLLSQLEELGISGYFEEVVSGNHKTDILDGKYNKESLVIGDTEADEETAERLGCTFIAVISGLRNEKYLAADRKIAALKELYESGN
jgi:phosphoglycolate phosphatase-like HAD superfamily hydrolase